jgi:hypothetical protein
VIVIRSLILGMLLVFNASRAGDRRHPADDSLAGRHPYASHDPDQPAVGHVDPADYIANRHDRR